MISPRITFIQNCYAVLRCVCVFRREPYVGVIRASLLPSGMDGGGGDDVVQALEFDEREAATCPRARVGEVQVIAVSLGRELAPKFDAVAKDGIFSHESASLADVRHRGVPGRTRLVQLCFMRYE